MIILLFTLVFILFFIRIYWSSLLKYYDKICNDKISNDIKIQLTITLLYPTTVISIFYFENFKFSSTFFYLSLLIITILLITQINNYSRLTYFKTLSKSQHSFYTPIFSNSTSNLNKKSNQSPTVTDLINKNTEELKLIYNNLHDEKFIEEIEFDEFIDNLINNKLKLLFTCAELHYFIKKINKELQTNIPYSISNLFLNKKGEKFKYKSVTNNSDKLKKNSKNRIDKIFTYEV